MLQQPSVLRFVTRTGFALALAICNAVAFAAIPLSTSTASTQNFDGIGTGATAALPADFRVDKPATVRTVGTFSAAVTATSLAGGANLSATASNGIYNFGSGTNTTGPDRSVGFLSSGTATQSGNLYAQFANNTGGSLSGLQISYNIEKYRGGSNAAGFRIQLFYSTDGTTWTTAGANFLTPFAADAANAGFTTAPGATVPVSNQTLTVSIPNGSNFFLAWNYSVTSGTTTTNAQALAIDDISILAVAGNTPTNPAGTGAANPSSVQAGNSTLLTVAVTPGTNPASTGLAVTADLTSIGGSPTQQFFDDGTHGDAVAGDKTFSFQALVPAATSAGAKNIPATITDAQVRSGTASISLTVTLSSTPPTGTGAANPNSLQAGATSLLTVSVTPGTNPVSTGLSVTGDLSSIGGSNTQTFFDDGTHGDVTANDSVFSFQATVAANTSPGTKSLTTTIADNQARSSTASISLTVQPPPPPTTVKITQVYGGGGNSGSTYTNDFIEIFNQSTTPIDVSFWSVQYSSANATSWAVTNLCPQNGSCVILPGHYYLVHEAQGAGGTTSLPAPDAVGTTNLSGTNGKIALVAGTTSLQGACPTGGNTVDLVAYGSTNCPSATGVLSNTTAAVRKGNGCIDTGVNSNDFVIIGPIPRDSGAPVNSCGGDPAQPSGLGLASPASLEPASHTLLTVKVTPATAPPSTGFVVSANLTSIGGASSQQFYDDGTHGDAIAGDNVFSFDALVGATIPTGVKYIVATITDAQARTVTAPITLTIESPTCGVERWSVKTGTDPDAGLVNLNSPMPSNIADLIVLSAPADPPGPPLNARIQTAETTVFVLNATLTLFKKETDVDYHLVLQDDMGRTMIAEIPSPACVGLTSPFASGIAYSRAKMDNRFNATPFFQTANVPVQVKGVGFFDFIHGQTGVAPNGIELHPLVDISFTLPTITTLTSNINPSQYGQTVAITAAVNNGGSITPTGHVTLFDGGSPIGTVVLNQSGAAAFNIATFSTGSHTLTASYEGDSTSAPSTSTQLIQIVNKADQTISFGPLAGKTFGDADFTLNATASSGLAVSFSIVSGPATVSGNIVHITGAGTVTVRASQAGSTNYNAAVDVDQPFVVAKANQTITFAALAGKTFGAPDFTLSATASSGLAVSFSIVSGPASLSGNTVHITGAGTVTVRASQAGNTNYNAAVDVDQPFVVTKANQTITFAPLAGKTFGDADFTLSATASSGLAVSFSIVSGPASLSGNTVHITGAGTVTVRASQAGNTDFNAAADVDQPFVVAKANQTITFAPLAGKTFGDPDFTLSATASSGLAVSFSIVSGPATVSGNTVHITGAGTVTVRASQAGNTDYNAAADVDQPFAVAKANQTVTFAPLAGKTFGDPDFTLSATASSGLAVSFSIISGPATVSGNTVHITGAGTVTVRASQAGNTNYNAAVDVDQPFVVAKANQTITFAPLPDKTYGDGPFNVSATGGASTQAVQFSASGGCTISGNTVTITGAGTCTVTASQAGDDNYNPAAPVSRSFTIGKATQSAVTVTAPGDATFGQAGLVATASGGSGTGAYSFSAGASTACTVDASTGAIGITAGAGTCVITASRAGDGNYNPSAPSAPVSINIHRASTTASAISSKNPSTFGDSVTFSASVSPATATGTVQFKIDGNNFGSPVALTNGSATSGAVSLLTAGNHSVTAVYGGDNNFAGSTAAVTQIVNAASASATVTSNLNPSVFGQLVTFAATVASGAGTPTGLVTFKDGPVSIGTAGLNTSGQALFATPVLLAGTHSITAVYGGDNNFSAGTSSPITQIVNQANTSTSLNSSQNPSRNGQSVTFTATTSAIAPGAGIPTGAVTFKDGTAILATVALDASGQATYTTTTLALGIHSISATYAGDSNFTGSASASLSQLVFAYLAGGGSFVIGDVNAVAGGHVTFWGSQWAKSNDLSGGSAPSSFKGFAISTSTNPPSRGGTWTSDPGNSDPPNSVPSYMAVIASSSVTKSGSTISGNIPQIVIIKTDAGYGSSPGQGGTGTVVAIAP